MFTQRSYNNHSDYDDDDDDDDNNNSNVKVQNIYHEKQHYMCHKF